MESNFSRLLDTLAILQRSQPLTTTQIRDRLASRGHGVTPRTVQRDLASLAQEHPIECDDRCKPFTWRWSKSAPRLSLPSMDWPEAVSFHLLETYLEGALPPSVKDSIKPYLVEARRKLEQSFEHLPLRRWPERVRVVHQGSPQIPPRVTKAVHDAFAEAVLLGRRLSIRYRGLEAPSAKAHVVSPLGLVQHGSVFYAPVRFDGHQDVRTLALHRVQRAALLPEASGIEDFDLDAWLAAGALGFGGNDMVALELKLFEGQGERLQESPLSGDQHVESLGGGMHTLTATVRDTVQLRRWLLSLGSRVEVQAPAGLRKAMRTALRVAAARY